jgi:uncharacterized membrane protein YdjX (TVP38/TMEM64 family)
VSKFSKKLTIAGLLVLTLASGSFFFPVIPTLQSLCNWIGGLGPIGVVVIALLMAIGSLIFLPASPFVIASAAVFGFGWGLACAAIGVTLGAAVGFLLSRSFLRQDISTHFRKHATFRAIDMAIAKEGWKIVILLRLCPIPFGLANYLYGLTAVGFRPYLFATILGSLPSTLLFCQLGATGKAGLEALASGHSEKGPGQLIFMGISVLATVAAIILIPRFAKRAMAKYTDLPDPAHEVKTEL